MEKFKFNKKINNLFKTILSLKSVKEAEKFFRDLCVIQEIKNMAVRWEIAQLLNKSVSYRKIAEKTKVSVTTVSRVAQRFNNSRNGYKLVLNRLNSHNHNSSSVGKGLC